MTKINLDSTQQTIAKKLIPGGDYNEIFEKVRDVSVSKEEGRGGDYWRVDIPLIPKDKEEREDTLTDLPHFQTELRLRKGPDGKRYLVVDPQVQCGAAKSLCSRLVPKVVQWRENLPGNLAVRSFAEEIMGEDPKDLLVISGSEFSRLKPDPSGSWEAYEVLEISAGIVLGLGAFGGLAYILKTRRAPQPQKVEAPAVSLKPRTFFIGKEPGEGGVTTDPRTEARKYISRRQVEITFDTKSGQYFARHVGINPTSIEGPQKNQVRLKQQTSSPLHPGDHLVIRAMDGREIFRIQFNPQANSKDPRQAFQFDTRAPTWILPSSPVEKGRSVPPPLPLEKERAAPPMPPKDKLLEPVKKEESREVKAGKVRRYEAEIKELHLVLEFEPMGPVEKELKRAVELRLIQISEPTKQTIPEAEIQWALEYARLKNPLTKVARDLEVERNGKQSDIKFTTEMIHKAEGNSNVEQAGNLRIYREHLVKQVWEMGERLSQYQKVLRDFQPFDLSHEVEALRKKQTRSAYEIEEQVRRLEGTLEYIPKHDQDAVRWAIDQLELERNHPEHSFSVETRAKVVTVLRYVAQNPTLQKHHATQAKIQAKIEDSLRRAGTHPHHQPDLRPQLKTELEAQMQTASPRAPYKLAELLAARDKAAEAATSEPRRSGPEGANPEFRSSGSERFSEAQGEKNENHPEDPRRKPGRGPGGGGRPEIRREDVWDVIEGPREMRELFEGPLRKSALHK